MTTPPRVLALGYLSIDRIGTPSGTFTDVPGGAALYAALGSRQAGAHTAIAAAIGRDYPASWLTMLSRLGLDLSGLSTRDGPTRSADLTYDAAGGRASSHFDDPLWEQRTMQLAPGLPDDFDSFDGVAIGPVPVETLQSTVDRPGAAAAILVADTSAAFVRRAPEALLALLPGLDVFAPSLEETRLLVPGAEDDAAAIALAGRGTDIVQKRGAAGAYVVHSRAARGSAVASQVASRVADATGAGDATVGALTAFLAQGLDLFEAAKRAMRIGALAVQAIGPSALGFDAWAGAAGRGGDR